MLVALRTHDQSKIAACAIERQSIEAEARARNSRQNGYVCPRCHEPVVLKQGRIVVPHFAHKPTLSCQFGQPETPAHLRAKQHIYDALIQSDRASSTEMERDFGTSIADVFTVLDGSPVAIEIQQSGLNTDELSQRTLHYHHLGIHVLWILLLKDTPATYKPKAWERWIHAAYFGRVYFWLEGLSFLPVHFQKIQQWVDARDWYDQDGQVNEAGGYWKTMKNQFTWQPSRNILQLTNDFRPVERQPFSAGDIDIPKCRLLIDKFPKWW